MDLSFYLSFIFASQILLHAKMSMKNATVKSISMHHALRLDLVLLEGDEGELKFIPSAFSTN